MRNDNLKTVLLAIIDKKDLNIRAACSYHMCATEKRSFIAALTIPPYLPGSKATERPTLTSDIDEVGAHPSYLPAA